MTPEQLAEIRARAEAATPGPWAWYEGEDDAAGLVEVAAALPEGACVLTVFGNDDAPDDALSNALFVVHARTDIPALLDYIEELQAVLWRAAGVYGEPLTDIEALRKSHRIISDFLTSKEPTNA